MTINTSNIKYWHTTTFPISSPKPYTAPTLEGVPLAELLIVDDGKAYIYHVPADEIANAQQALITLFTGE